MYKGETSVPEAQLTSLIKAAEGLKVRGLTSSDQSLPPGVGASSRHSSRHNSPMPPGTPTASNATPTLNGPNFSGRSVHYSPARYPPSSNSEEPHPKVPHLSTDQSTPMSLTTHDPDARRSAEDRCSASSASARASPGPPGSGPRRKQARPRRRSGDSIGHASLDLSKADSPPFRKSPSHLDDATPENLSMKRPSSSPAINLVSSTAQLIVTSWFLKKNCFWKFGVFWKLVFFEKFAVLLLNWSELSVSIESFLWKQYTLVAILDGKKPPMAKICPEF